MEQTSVRRYDTIALGLLKKEELEAEEEEEEERRRRRRKKKKKKEECRQIAIFLLRAVST